MTFMGLLRDFIKGFRENICGHYEKHHTNVEKIQTTAATPAVVGNDQSEAERKKERWEKIFKIVVIYGFITSAIALAQAISQKESDSLIITNVVLTFAASVLNFGTFLCVFSGPLSWKART